jgi:hypothetical protein
MNGRFKKNCLFYCLLFSSFFLLFYISLEIHFFFFAVAVLHVEW